MFRTQFFTKFAKKCPLLNRIAYICTHTRYIPAHLYTIINKKFTAMKQPLLVKVKGLVTLFDEAPPLNTASSKAPHKYWLIHGDTIEYRVCTRGNLIEDLYQVLEREPFRSLPRDQKGTRPQIEVHLTSHTEEEAAVEPTYKELRGRVPFHQKAICYYNAETDRLVELYPTEEACAKDLGLTKYSVHTCNWGNTAVINGSIITTNHYLTQEELDLRRAATARLGTGRAVRVYVYDYNGDAVGVFATMSDTAHELGIDYRNVRRGLLNPGRLQQGYYFYLNPDSRPPVSRENLL